MGRNQRFALLGIAAMIAAVAVVIALASGGGDDKKSDTTNAADTTATTATTSTRGAPPPSKSTDPVPGGPRPVQVTKIKVKSGEPVGGPVKLSFKKRDQVDIVVTADEADEAHLHGYDIEKKLKPGETVRFRFEATLEGVFELELHHSGAQLAKVTVKP
jgi:hypothetical protein